MLRLKAIKIMLTAACMTTAFASFSAGIDYPSKPIQIIVPQPPGGFNDVVSRLVANKLTGSLGQPVVVQNQPGAAAQLGTTSALRAPADGYTLLVAAFPHGTNPSLRKALPYDTLGDFRSVIQLGQTPNVLVVKSDSPLKSLEDVIKQAKENPAKLNYASSGAGSSPHLSMEMLKSMADIDIVHVPYKGGAAMATDLIGGQVDIMFDNTPNVMPLVEDGKLRAIAVTSEKATDLAPGIPPVDAIVPGYQMQAWYGLVVRREVPDEIVKKLNEEIQKILLMPDVRETFAKARVEPVGGTPEQFDQYIKNEITKWEGVIRKANITIE